MLGVDLFCDEAFIRHCIRVTNPNVEKGRVLPLQKTTSVNVEPGIRCSLRTRCQHFSVYLLKYRLNLDVIASSSSISASKSRNSLCLWMMKPLRLHTMVWSTSKTSPHAQVDGVSLSCHHISNEWHLWILSYLELSPQGQKTPWTAVRTLIRTYFIATVYTFSSLF